MRGLAALPVVPVMPGTGRLQAVWIDDVTKTVEYFLSPDSPGRQVIELAGQQTYSFEALVVMLRDWMRWPPALQIRVPGPLGGLFYRLGDFVSLLGWRPLIRSTAQKEIVRGAASDGIAAEMPVSPTSLREVLAREPAPVQERWFARMYFVKPLTFTVLALF